MSISAFPHKNQFPSQKGMTLRDYFAAQALTGICSTLNSGFTIRWGEIATDAYIAADAMLEAREQNK